MYHEYLNTKDFSSLLSDNTLDQLIRGNSERLRSAEGAAVDCFLEHLSDGYEIEKVIDAGIAIKDYNIQITYPAGTYFYYKDTIVKTLRAIGGCKRPSNKVYWEEYSDIIPDDIAPYSQLKSYSPGDVVMFSDCPWVCVEYNGLDFDDVRFPGVVAWSLVEFSGWIPNYEYNAWDVVG